VELKTPRFSTAVGSNLYAEDIIIIIIIIIIMYVYATAPPTEQSGGLMQRLTVA